MSYIYLYNAEVEQPIITKDFACGKILVYL